MEQLICSYSRMGLIYRDAEEEDAHDNNTGASSSSVSLGINDARRVRRYLRSIARDRQHNSVVHRDNVRLRKELWKMHAGLARCLASAAAATIASPLNEVVRLAL